MDKVIYGSSVTRLRIILLSICDLVTFFGQQLNDENENPRRGQKSDQKWQKMTTYAKSEARFVFSEQKNLEYKLFNSKDHKFSPLSPVPKSYSLGL